MSSGTHVAIAPRHNAPPASRRDIDHLFIGHILLRTWRFMIPRSRRRPAVSRRPSLLRMRPEVQMGQPDFGHADAGVVIHTRLRI
jgi:hypothetical protein